MICVRFMSVPMAVVVAGSVAACGLVGVGDSGKANQGSVVSRLRGGTFGDRQVDLVAGVLTRAGADISGGFTKPGTAPVRLTRWQVRNLAAEAYSGGGQTGAEINEDFPTPAGMPPLGFVINAWMIRYDSEAARFARALVGEHDWKHPETIVYPRLVFSLFFADATSGRNAPAASVAPTTSATPVAYRQRAVGCDSVVEYVESSLKNLANLLKVDASGSGAFVRFLASVWNTVVDLAAAVVKGLITAVTAPVVEAIGGVLTAVGAAYQISALVKQWVVKLEPVPATNAFGIGAPNPGRFRLTVTDDRFELPTELETCSKAAGVDLARAGAPGSTVTWTAVPGGRPDLAVRTGADAVIGENRTATFSYSTGVETAQQAKGTEVSGTYEVRASIRRDKIEQLRVFIADTLLKPLAGLPLPEVVRNFIRGLAADAIGRATDKLAEYTDVKAYGVTHISYHEPTQPKSPPPTQPTMRPPARGDLCDLVTTGTYTGNLTWSSTDTANAVTQRLKGTGPITFTIAADGTVSGSFTSNLEGDRSDDTYGPLGSIEGGKITGTRCRPQLDTTGARQHFLPNGPTITIPFNWFGTIAPQPSTYTVNGRILTATGRTTTPLGDDAGTRNATTTLTGTR
jgi:hypothetical protein